MEKTNKQEKSLNVQLMDKDFKLLSNSAIDEFISNFKKDFKTCECLTMKSYFNGSYSTKLSFMYYYMNKITGTQYIQLSNMISFEESNAFERLTKK